MVTGANSGLGLEMAKCLAKRGCTLMMVCRSEERGKAALEEVRSACSDNRDVHLKICDMASLQSIATLCSELDSKQTRLYLLINNAGLMVRIKLESPCFAVAARAGLRNLYGPVLLQS